MSNLDTTFFWVKNKNGRGIYVVKSKNGKPVLQKTIIEIKKNTLLKDLCDEQGIDWEEDG